MMDHSVLQKMSLHASGHWTTGKKLQRLALGCALLLGACTPQSGEVPSSAIALDGQAPARLSSPHNWAATAQRDQASVLSKPSAALQMPPVLLPIHPAYKPDYTPPLHVAETAPRGLGIHVPVPHVASRPSASALFVPQVQGALQPGERVRLVIENDHDADAVLTVSASGELTLPLAGKLSVRNLTLDAAQAEITRVYADGYFVNPRLTLTRLSRN